MADREQEQGHQLQALHFAYKIKEGFQIAYVHYDTVTV